MSNVFNALIIENRAVSKDCHILAIEPLSDISHPKPGNFFMLSVDDALDPLLKRPLSIHNVNGQTLHFLYRVQGRGTAALSKKRQGSAIEVVGPLGNHFPVHRRRKNIILVAGGIGIAPIYYLACKLKNRTPHLFFGAKDKKGILLIKNIKQLNVPFKLATDDGSVGLRGNVVDLVLKDIKSSNFSADDSVIYACGPELMIEGLAKLSIRYSLLSYAAFERNMACGVGTCLGCVINTKNGYKRVCREGPIFRLHDIVWDN